MKFHLALIQRSVRRYCVGDTVHVDEKAVRAVSENLRLFAGNGRADNVPARRAHHGGGVCSMRRNVV